MVKLSDKTLKHLRDLINEETAYRSGPQLVRLFNSVGFRDVYGQGFPSRSTYTQNRLERINGTPEIEKIIRAVFSPREFSGNPEKFKTCLAAFNAELRFDGWAIYWNETLRDISFRRVDASAAFEDIVQSRQDSSEEDAFLQTEFADVDFSGLIAIPGVQVLVEERWGEVQQCVQANAPLATIFLIGSIMEAVLLSIATANSRSFVRANSAPKDKQGKVVPIPSWRLEALINVAKELGYLKEDVHRFCHVVRDFRNYIHPFEQSSRQFSPDINTAKICLQVLKGALAQIHEKMKECLQ